MTPEQERGRIAAYIRRRATQMLLEALNRDQYDLENVDRTATLLDSIADAIEAGDHWETEE